MPKVRLDASLTTAKLQERIVQTGPSGQLPWKYGVFALNSSSLRACIAGSRAFICHHRAHPFQLTLRGIQPILSFSSTFLPPCLLYYYLQGPATWRLCAPYPGVKLGPQSPATSEWPPRRMGMGAPGSWVNSLRALWEMRCSSPKSDAKPIWH